MYVIECFEDVLTLRRVRVHWRSRCTAQGERIFVYKQILGRDQVQNDLKHNSGTMTMLLVGGWYSCMALLEVMSNSPIATAHYCLKGLAPVSLTTEIQRRNLRYLFEGWEGEDAWPYCTILMQDSNS